jgi:splicing suppressor protein 51
MADEPPPIEKSCNACGKTDCGTTSLKKCSRCKSAWYCSQRCQKTDWKFHKEACTIKSQANAHAKALSKAVSGAVAAAAAALTSSPSDEKPSETNRRFATDKFEVLDVEVAMPFHQLRSYTWLHGRSERDVFKLLIDTYRLRVEDERPHCKNFLYVCIEDFGRYLRQAESNRELMPEWWTSEKGVECMLFASDGDDWSTAVVDVSEMDIQRYYPELFMTLQMRVFAEQVLGGGPGGKNSISTIEIYLIAEQGKLLTLIPR